MNADTRQTLLSLLETAVAAAHPKDALPPFLPPVPDNGKLIVLGAGKAAAAMTQAVEAHYSKLGVMDRLNGFVTTRVGFGLPVQYLELVEAGHPVPDAQSERSSIEALKRAGEAGPDDLILVLLSGGASALWCAPVEGLTLADKQDLCRKLLKSGARISEINCVRKHISRIKGGRLALAAAPTRMLTLAISDVPGDDPAGIGSGPTVGDPTTLAEANAILEKYGIEKSPALAAALADPANETVNPGDAALSSSEYKLIATPHMSLQAAASKATELGYTVQLLGDDLEGEARDLAKTHAELALAAKARGERVALFSGGEVTVTIKGNGRGGPNQEYALALALALNGEDNITALAADTDGTDGGEGEADDPAGALIDPSTLSRAEAAGLTPATFLENNDSGGFFAAINDLIIRGPTQTNVNDFRAILIDP